MTHWFPRCWKTKGIDTTAHNWMNSDATGKGSAGRPPRLPSGWIGAFANRTTAAGSVTASNQVAYTGTSVEVAALATTGGGRQQFLNLLFDLGYGPVEIAEEDLLKIGDRPFDEYRGVTWQFHDGAPGEDSRLTQFDDRHFQLSTNEPLEPSTWIEATTSANTSRLVLLITFPGGLGTISAPGRHYRGDRCVQDSNLERLDRQLGQSADVLTHRFRDRITVFRARSDV